MRPTPAHVLNDTMDHETAFGDALPAPDAQKFVNLAESFFPGIRDQGSERACSGFSVAQYREIRWGITHGTKIPHRLSPAYPYARARMGEGTYPIDAGASMADEFDVAHCYGICLEDTMPYDQDPGESIPNIADAEAYTYRIDEPCTVDLSDPDNAKSVLIHGMPISISIPCYQSFMDCPADGRLKIPDTKAERMLGGHGLVIAGFDETTKSYYVINQWGTTWGLNGYCWMPYDYPIWEGWTAPANDCK